MKNNKGFTLVELLAMLVVLGIIMGVTIPNITGILSQSKKTAFMADATKMIETAKIKIVTHKTGPASEKIPKINSGECIILTLDYLNDNEDIGKGPNDGTYLDYDSFVIYRRNGNKYEYYVRLIEESNGKYTGIDFVKYQNLEKENVQIKKLSSDKLKGFGVSTTLEDIQTNPNKIVSACDNDKVKYYQ